MCHPPDVSILHSLDAVLFSLHIAIVVHLRIGMTTTILFALRVASAVRPHTGTTATILFPSDVLHPLIVTTSRPQLSLIDRDLISGMNHHIRVKGTKGIQATLLMCYEGNLDKCTTGLICLT